MAYFVTGATGFIGRHLVQELLDHRDGEVFVLVRPESRHRLEHLLRSWGSPARVSVVTGDLTNDRPETTPQQLLLAKLLRGVHWSPRAGRGR